MFIGILMWMTCFFVQRSTIKTVNVARANCHSQVFLLSGADALSKLVQNAR